MENIVLFIISLLTIGGYIYFGKNIWREAEKDFFILPWITFSFLAGLDLANILFSEEQSWTELFSGILLFLGPLIVSFLIVLNGVQRQRLRKRKIFIQKIKEEYKKSKAEPTLLLIGFFVLLLLILLDQISKFGNSYLGELIFAIVTIFLDLIASFSLFHEIREDVKKFEKKSWSMFCIAACLAYAWNLITGASAFSIGSILIAESACISASILLSILIFERYKK